MEPVYSYSLLTLSTVMFGVTFFFKDIFRKHYGSDLQATLVTSIGGGIFGLLALLIIKGFVLEFSWFALIMALISSVNSLLFSFCSLKALGKINLSLYSLFSMLGGMTLPFLSGICFHGEALTIGKLACFAVIAVALFLTAEKEKAWGDTKYYVGIFVFNGMSGVIAKIYQALPFERISSAGYSILTALVSIALAGCLILTIKTEKRKIDLPCLFALAGSGILNRLANWILLIALVSLPASAQYPFVTGGTMIISTAISLLTAKKPCKREIAAVILSFIGILLLTLMPKINIFSINWR